LKSTLKTKIKPKEMRLIVDSGSTKADWIAIDEDGKVLFTTNLWIKSRSFENNEIIDRLNDRFDILQNKKKNTTHFFFMALVVVIK
jgi:hypothetical protein